MREALNELLSRYLDGDLPEAEAAELELRFESEPELREALGDLEAVRSAVRDLAAGMEPPAELDALMEPLRRSKPKPRGLRQAYAWLAAAATIVIGVGVAFELQRRVPTPAYETVANNQVVPNARKDGYFQLQPLPTAAPGEDLVGVAEHLLAEPPADSSMPAEPELAPPMVVVGPLNEPDAAASGFAQASTDATVVITAVDGRVREMTASVGPDVAAGRYRLRLKVAANRIIDCAGYEKDRSAGAAVCASLVIPDATDLTDGEFEVVILVEGR